MNTDNYIYDLSERDIKINSLVEHQGEIYKVCEVVDDQIKTYDDNGVFWIDIAMIDYVINKNEMETI